MEESSKRPRAYIERGNIELRLASYGRFDSSFRQDMTDPLFSANEFNVNVCDTDSEVNKVHSVEM